MENILKLMKKEVIFIKGAMRMQIVTAILFLIIFPLTNAGMSFTGAIVVPYFLIYGTMAYEERSKGESFMLTLPITRGDLCRAKYLLGIIYAFFSTVVTGIMVMIGKVIKPQDELQLYFADNILLISAIGFFIIVVYIAVILPILLKYGTDKTSYIMMLLYMGGFAISWIITPAMMEFNIQINIFWGIIMCIGIYILSYMSSLKIYEKREFR